MEGSFYFILLILSVILPEEICASTEKSLDTQVRKKRLVNFTRSRVGVDSIHQVPYVVQILNNGKEWYCAGTILSPIDIITSGFCVATPAKYQVVSNSVHVGQGIIHNVTRITVHEQYNPQLKKNDLAMIQISPAIDFVRSGNRPIPLHIGENPDNSLPVTSGWGCTGFEPGKATPVFRRELQSIGLSIIADNLCKRKYPKLAERIDDTIICARDSYGMKISCYGDSGNPLVANNHLLGIMVGSASYPHPNYPDLFTKVYHHTYVEWINKNKHDERLESKM